MVRIPKGPTFIRFCSVNSLESKNTFIEELKNFFNEQIEDLTTSISVSKGRYITALMSTDTYNFTFKQNQSFVRWELIFFDVAVPHIKLTLWESDSPLKFHFLERENAKLVLNSLSFDIATGLEIPKPITLREKLFPLFHLKATYQGKWEWIYIIVKLGFLPNLSEKLLLTPISRIPLDEFCFCIKERIRWFESEFIYLSLTNKEAKTLIKKLDLLILNAFSQQELKDWLDRLDLKYREWFQ